MTNLLTAANWQAVLPWPPSVNRYWRHWWDPKAKNAGTVKRGAMRHTISERGRAYRRLVGQYVAYFHRLSEPLDGPLGVAVEFCEPDRRKRDLDNLHKGIWDALQAAGVYSDDHQIRERHETVGNVVPKGLVRIAIWQMEAGRLAGVGDGTWLSITGMAEQFLR